MLRLMPAPHHSILTTPVHNPRTQRATLAQNAWWGLCLCCYPACLFRTHWAVWSPAQEWLRIRTKDLNKTLASRSKMWIDLSVDESRNNWKRKRWMKKSGGRMGLMGFDSSINPCSPQEMNKFFYFPAPLLPKSSLCKFNSAPVMTTYGTIPTSSSSLAPSNLAYISAARHRIKAGLGTRRPWSLLFNFRSFLFPSTFAHALSRTKANVAFFRMNYAIIVLFVLFLSLLWHPISLIVFIVMMAVWLFLYFLRDEPLLIFGRTIDDRVVLGALLVLTILFLLLTHATLNILVALLIGVVVVVVHGAVRKTDDLVADEEATGLIPPGSSSSS